MLFFFLVRTAYSWEGAVNLASPFGSPLCPLPGPSNFWLSRRRSFHRFPWKNWTLQSDSAYPHCFWNSEYNFIIFITKKVGSNGDISDFFLSGGRGRLVWISSGTWTILTENFPPSLQANAGTVTQSRKWEHLSMSLPIHYLLIILVTDSGVK